jgi:dTDP-4-dehydrorhamnose reductase
VDIYGKTHPEELVVKRVVDIATVEYPTPAQRPIYSVLGGEKLTEKLGIVMPSWESQLAMSFG